MLELPQHLITLLLLAVLVGVHKTVAEVVEQVATVLLGTLKLVEVERQARRELLQLLQITLLLLAQVVQVIQILEVQGQTGPIQYLDQLQAQAVVVVVQQLTGEIILER